jgi:hypothetical protein
MAALPSYVKVMAGSITETPASVTISSEMDRGVAKVRRKNSDTMVDMPASLWFDNVADVASFETWFYSSTGAGGGAAFFTMTHPRTGATINARIKDGELGALTPLHGRWPGPCKRDVKFEFLRSAY